MTFTEHPEQISRVHEVAVNIEVDYYVCVNGDEPLVDEGFILPVIPAVIHRKPYFGSAMRTLTDPAKTIDFVKIKLFASDQTGRCLYMSRSPVPCPRGYLLFSYKKYVGVECFNRAALDFFVDTPMGEMGRIKDIDYLRFLEHGVELHFSYVDSGSISVDTPKNLEKVRCVMEKRLMAADRAAWQACL